MSPAEQPTHEHQVGITNAQEQNPDAEIGRLTAEMNALFAAKRYAEAARIALSITALSKDELRETFERHGVQVLHLDHEAFGIYAGVIEPSYDLRVDGPTPGVLAAATEFGKRHAQEAVLIARKSQEGERDPAERFGLALSLHAPIFAEEAVVIAAMVQACGFKGATFVPKRGEVVIYHTDDLEMTPEQFDVAAAALIEKVKPGYPQLTGNQSEVHHRNEEPMIPEPSLNDRVAAFNARLKANGIYEERDPWSLPTLYEGSILDVPETPESRERIEQLKQQIAEVQRERQAREGAAIKESAAEPAQETQSLPPEEPALEEPAPATNRA